MNAQPYLFIASNLSRGLITLATTMQRKGIPVLVAAPARPAETARLRIRHLRLRRIQIFSRTFLFSGKSFRDAVAATKPRIHALDRAARDLCRARRLEFDDRAPEFGIDLSVFNPTSVATLLQSRFLSDFNIAPHQKLVAVISPPGFNIEPLVRAMDILDSTDLVVALFGVNSRKIAARLSARIEKSGRHIVCAGPDYDAATVLRSSYAVLSLGNADPALLMSAVAMGRPAIWHESEHGVAPNIRLKSAANPQNIAAALGRAMNLSPSERTRIEKQNLQTAKKFDVEKTIKKLTAGS
ncbi:MAG: hypothetical protein FWE17_00340 [Alphaproteobacteria bacterium]|nr:hypothetical protein [Alphaproteobacteria bacterium]MCL2757741.1 hypothetical protein [Alphaproteobacteria bacterium]